MLSVGSVTTIPPVADGVNATAPLTPSIYRDGEMAKVGGGGIKELETARIGMLHQAGRRNGGRTQAELGRRTNGVPDRHSTRYTAAGQMANTPSRRWRGPRWGLSSAACCPEAMQRK